MCGCTPLLISSENGHLQVVRFLMEANADVNAKDNKFSGRTTLQWASWNDHREVVRCVIEANVDINADADKRTPE